MSSYKHELNPYITNYQQTTPFSLLSVGLEWLFLAQVQNCHGYRGGFIGDSRQRLQERGEENFWRELKARDGDKQTQIRTCMPVMLKCDYKNVTHHPTYMPTQHISVLIYRAEC